MRKNVDQVEILAVLLYRLAVISLLVKCVSFFLTLLLQRVYYKLYSTIPLLYIFVFVINFHHHDHEIELPNIFKPKTNNTEIATSNTHEQNL